ncbi:uncharacterized protein FFE2_14784 [Fusarium fujikuroi]|nr:uncharacterized protein FFE2_14784 [Fusarium fujikuroi]
MPLAYRIRATDGNRSLSFQAKSDNAKYLASAKGNTAIAEPKLFRAFISWDKDFAF